MKCQHCGHDLSEHGSLGCMYEYEKPQSDGSLFCSCALTRNNAELTAAQARITELENVCRTAERELRIASNIAHLSPRDKVEFSNAANMLLAVLQDTTP